MNGTSATSAREIHSPVSSSNTASGYAMAVQASSGIAAIAALTFGSSLAMTDTCEPVKFSV